MKDEIFKVKVKSLTPIWTGDENGKCITLRETGIIGSLRWWYEALIRGLGGYACDPTSDDKNFKKCELKHDKFNKTLKSGKSIQEELNEQICPVCQLFGCTGWSRRFRLEINGISENDIIKGKSPAAGLKPKTIFNLEFTFLSDLSPEEKWLFKKTLLVIENYGAIGGRTTWKPNGKWGTSYGLIKVEDYGDLRRWDTFSNIDKVKYWLRDNKEAAKKNNPNWFSFNFYWIIEGRYLTRWQINKIVGRNPNNSQKYLSGAGNFDKWLGGEISSERSVSKKIFSFENPDKVFGYVRNNEELIEIRKKIKNALNEDIKLKTGKEILEGLG